MLGTILFLLPLVSQIKEIDNGQSAYLEFADTVSSNLPLSTSIPMQTEYTMVLNTPEAAPQNTVLAAKPVHTSTAPSRTDSPHPIPTEVPARPAVDLSACRDQNSDFVAWLTIPGTPVNYPVVRTDDSAYYLNHLFTGERSSLGCLFSLTSSDFQKPSKNIAIFGHHLSHGEAMFSSLLRYKNQEYYRQHPTIQLDTLYGSRTYTIFAALNMTVSSWDAATAHFQHDKAFLQFVHRAEKKAFYDTGIDVQASDHILTLITCDRSYGGASGRFLIMAIEKIEGGNP